MPDDDALQVLGLDAAQELLEPEHVLERTRARLGAGRHDLREAHQDEQDEDAGGNERDCREQNEFGEKGAARTDEDGQPEGEAVPFLLDLVGAVAIEAALLEPVIDGVLDQRQLLVELVLQVVERHVIVVARKDAMEDGGLMQLQPLAGLEAVQGVRDGAAEQAEQLRRLVLLDAQVSAYRQIHERRGDVPHVRTIVDQRAGFGRRHRLGRLVLHGDRPAPRIPAGAVPRCEREEKHGDRNEERPVTARRSPRAGQQRGRRDDPLVPTDHRRQPFVVLQGMRHRDAHEVPVDLHGRVSGGRAVHAVERDRAYARGGRWQLDRRRRGTDRDVPFIARHVPVQLVVLVEKAQAVGRVIAQHDRPVGISGARNPDLELDVRAQAAGLGFEVVTGIVLRALQRDPQRPVQSLRRPVRDRDRAIQSVVRPDESRRDRLRDVDAGIAIDTNSRIEPLDRVRALCAERCGRQPQEHEDERHLRHGPLGRIVQAKEFARLEAHHPCDDPGRELRDRGIEVANHGVVVAPRVLQMVFDIGQRGLQRGEARGRLELGIRLGDGKYPLQRIAERVFFAGARGRSRLGRLYRTPAGRDDCLERASLVAGVALDDCHHIRDEIVPAFQLHVDIGPGVVTQLPQARQAIEGEDGPSQDEQPDDRNETHGLTLARQRSECEDGLWD